MCLLWGPWYKLILLPGSAFLCQHKLHYRARVICAKECNGCKMYEFKKRKCRTRTHLFIKNLLGLTLLK